MRTLSQTHTRQNYFRARIGNSQTFRQSDTYIMPRLCHLRCVYEPIFRHEYFSSYESNGLLPCWCLHLCVVVSMCAAISVWSCVCVAMWGNVGIACTCTPRQQLHHNQQQWQHPSLLSFSLLHTATSINYAAPSYLPLAPSATLAHWTDWRSCAYLGETQTCICAWCWLSWSSYQSFVHSCVCLSTNHSLALKRSHRTMVNMSMPLTHSKRNNHEQ